LFTPDGERLVLCYTAKEGQDLPRIARTRGGAADARSDRAVAGVVPGRTVEQCPAQLLIESVAIADGGLEIAWRDQG